MCNCGGTPKKTGTQRKKEEEKAALDDVRRKSARESMNPSKILEVSAYRCDENHVLVTPDGPDTETEGLVEDCFSGLEPRIRLKPGTRGSRAALEALGLPPRRKIQDSHVFGETTIGIYVGLCDRFPFGE